MRFDYLFEAGKSAPEDVEAETWSKLCLVYLSFQLSNGIDL